MRSVIGEHGIQAVPNNRVKLTARGLEAGIQLSISGRLWVSTEDTGPCRQYAIGV